MLTSLVLQLEAEGEAGLPANLGRAGLALALRLIGGREPGLAQALHDAQGPKPLTVSNLVLGKRAEGRVQVQAGQVGWLRLTGLNGAVSDQWEAVAGAPPESVDLDGRRFWVRGATLDGAVHPWAGRMSYQDLAGPFLLGGRERLGPAIRLEFASPTTFRSGGHYVPLPLPELVFGSLLDKWQSFAPIALHPEARRFAAEAVVLSRYELRTRGMPYGKAEGGRMREAVSIVNTLGGTGGQQGASIVNMMIGFTGRVVFTALNRDRYWLSVLHLLSAFAFFSGVGYQTGAGLGQAREF